MLVLIPFYSEMFTGLYPASTFLSFSGQLVLITSLFVNCFSKRILHPSPENKWWLMENEIRLLYSFLSCIASEASWPWPSPVDVASICCFSQQSVKGAVFPWELPWEERCSAALLINRSKSWGRTGHMYHLFMLISKLFIDRSGHKVSPVAVVTTEHPGLMKY